MNIKKKKKFYSSSNRLYRCKTVRQDPFRSLPSSPGQPVHVHSSLNSPLSVSHRRQPSRTASASLRRSWPWRSGRSWRRGCRTSAGSSTQSRNPPSPKVSFAHRITPPLPSQLDVIENIEVQRGWTWHVGVLSGQRSFAFSKKWLLGMLADVATGRSWLMLW